MQTKVAKINIKAPAKITPASKHRAPTRGPGKTFQKDGHWIENPNKAAVLMCACGNRYLKTRPHRMKCLRCISQGK
jgi:hypothetical protein